MTKRRCNIPSSAIALLDNPNNDASLMARTLKGHDRTKFIAAHGNWRPDTSTTPGVAGLSAIECARVKAVMVHGRTRPSRTIRMSGRRVQHSSAAHQKEGPDRASKTQTGDEQAAFPCRRSDVLAMREKSGSLQASPQPRH